MIIPPDLEGVVQWAQKVDRILPLGSYVCCRKLIAIVSNFSPVILLADRQTKSSPNRVLLYNNYQTQKYFNRNLESVYLFTFFLISPPQVAYFINSDCIVQILMRFMYIRNLKACELWNMHFKIRKRLICFCVYQSVHRHIYIGFYGVFASLFEPIHNFIEIILWLNSSVWTVWIKNYHVQSSERPLSLKFSEFLL